MTLPVPENQPYAVIFRLHTHTPPTPHPHTHPHTHTNTNTNNFKTKQNKQKTATFLFAYNGKHFWDCSWVRPIKNDTPSTGKTSLCHNILITQPTKNICLHGKLFQREKAERLREKFTGVQGAGPGGGCKGVAPPKFGICWAKMHNLVPFLPTFLSKYIYTFFGGWKEAVLPSTVCIWGAKNCNFEPLYF